MPGHHRWGHINRRPNLAVAEEEGRRIQRPARQGKRLALADRTAEAVDQPGSISDDVIKAAHEVEKRIRGFEQAQAAAR